MKKTLAKIGKVLIAILFCLIGAGAGILLSATLFSGFFNIFEVAIGVLGLLISFYLSTIVHEGGHLVFGLLSGYSFSSFRIGNIMWIKQDGKINIRNLSITGTGGQCLMAPPESKDAKIPVILYNLGGVIANVILCAVFGLVYYLFLRINILVSLICLFGAIISFFIALTNGIPLNVGGVANDGMNAVQLSKNLEATRAFRNQLLMNSAQARGVRISNMPDEWFTLPKDADMQNVHNASIAVFAVSRALDKCDTLMAEQEINKLLNSGYNIIGLHKNLLKCDLIYARLINHGDNANISSLLTAEQMKFMQSMKNFPSIIRTEYSIALLRDNDEQKADLIRQNFEKIAKKYPYSADIDSERDLLNLAAKKYKNKI